MSTTRERGWNKIPMANQKLSTGYFLHLLLFQWSNKLPNFTCRHINTDELKLGLSHHSKGFYFSLTICRWENARILLWNKKRCTLTDLTWDVVFKERISRVSCTGSIAKRENNVNVKTAISHSIDWCAHTREWELSHYSVWTSGYITYNDVGWVQFHSSTCGYLVFATLFIHEIVHPLLYFIGIFPKDRPTMWLKRCLCA